MLLNRFTYPVIAVVSLARHVSKLILQAPSLSAAVIYQAGQYIKVVHHSGDESLLSIASAPSDSLQFELHLSHAPKNQQAHDILAMVKQDQVLSFHGAYGVCTAARLPLDRPIIFFVRGTGFAPAKAMLEELAKLKSCPPLHLYWGTASQDDFYLPELIKNWENHFAHFRFTPMVSRSADQYQLHHAVLKEYHDLSRMHVYASGGEQMVFSALEVFQRHGLNEAHFHSDML